MAQLDASAQRLRLRALKESDELAVRAAQDAMRAERFEFLFRLDDASTFAALVAALEARRTGRDVPAGWVPESFFVGEVDGEIVGRLSLRHTLNEKLETHGGHIGFGVLPGQRRRGYASAMLRRGLDEARALGLTRVLLTCAESNIGSRTVIERHGGQYSGSTEQTADEEARRLYWITL